MQALKNDLSYTYSQYASWESAERCELINGKVYMMAAPYVTHQRIVGGLFNRLYAFLQGKTCEVFVSPIDVCLNALSDDDYDVFQPDIIVVCDPSKLKDLRFCNGAPDMAVEVLSPSSARMDKLVKYIKYQKAGVREYWIVDPSSKTVQVCILKDGEYFVKAYGDNETVSVSVLEGCEVDLTEIFAGH